MLDILDNMFPFGSRSHADCAQIIIIFIINECATCVGFPTLVIILLRLWSHLNQYKYYMIHTNLLTYKMRWNRFA